MGARVLCQAMNLSFETFAQTGHSLRMRALILLLCIFCLSGKPAWAATQVDLELVLAADISFSVDEEEAKRQREGYLAALTSEEVIDAILSGPNGSIAIAYVEWADDSAQYLVADWTLIRTKEDALAFADILRAAPFVQGRYTAIGSAITACVDLIEQNQFDGFRKIIDISGDGPQNQGKSLPLARALAAGHDITINGLPVLPKDENPWRPRVNVDVEQYYRENVIIGSAAFVTPAEDFEAFQEAILKKLILEIAWVPGAQGTDSAKAAP
ncbi:hypothetical protein MNBD_ALPHA06-1422 [hydrothermal vent metagenome]|uniref:VWFA domain-containing protein n=1 Tax=hydrothermal vent metagenome TaxID=652676 RepID=A0A3B0SN01_9ZZZZ